jgi:hypothetical protein
VAKCIYKLFDQQNICKLKVKSFKKVHRNPQK